jgi:predicted RNA-binding Zn-ribbon protein involved in translation (DUF1610 family)
MARQKSADEVFCESCGEIIKKQAEICPNCGVRNSRTSRNQTGSSSSSDIDIEEVAPIVAWGGGILLLLSGLGTVVEPEGQIIRATLSGILLILTGLFSLPPIRKELKDQIDIQFSRANVAIIVIVGLFIGATIAPA